MRVGQRWLRERCGVLLTVSVLSLLGGMERSWGAVVSITARPEATVQGTSIRLRDVAEIHSDDSELVARLQDVVLGQAPPLDVEQQLSRSTILMRLKHQGVSGQALQVLGAQRVRVRRATQRLLLPQLETVVRQGLRQRLQPLAPALVIQTIRGLESVAVPPGPVHYDVLTPSQPARSGPMTFTLTIQVAGKVERQLSGTAQVVLPQDTTDLQERAATASGGRQAAPALALESRHPMAKKPVGMPRNLDSGPLVRRGDLVQIVSESALIKVSTPGEALEAGRLGETIRVKNSASNREVRAQILDKQTVRVSL